jgi:DNA invertase Pin-like site-specific DNA recombinase
LPFERELIRERTGEGRKRAMAEGVKFGRKRKLSEYRRAEAIIGNAKSRIRSLSLADE